MCVIAACEKRPMTKDEFQNCFDSNSHGCGFAWRENGTVRMEKGFMDLTSAWNFYEKIKDILPHVAHFRIRTAGAVCQQLTHPFIVSDCSPLLLSYTGKNPVLFHNGVYWNWESEIPSLEKKMGRRLKGHMSDSRFLALGLFFEAPTFVRQMKHSGAFVLVKSDKISVMGDQFIKENGVYFSNSSYKRYKYTGTTTVYGTKTSGYEDDPYYDKWWKKDKAEDETSMVKDAIARDKTSIFKDSPTNSINPPAVVPSKTATSAATVFNDDPAQAEYLSKYAQRRANKLNAL